MPLFCVSCGQEHNKEYSCEAFDALLKRTKTARILKELVESCRGINKTNALNSAYHKAKDHLEELKIS